MRTRAVVLVVTAVCAALLLGACESGTPQGSTPSTNATTGPTTTAEPTTSSTGAAGAPQTIDELVDFVSSGAPVALATYGGDPIASFSTPSGNISCGVFGAPSDAVLCYVNEVTGWPPAATLACNDHGDWVPNKISVSTEGNLRGGCISEQSFPVPAPVLPYGSTITNNTGTVACRSDAAFLACVRYATLALDDASGFLASREFYTTFGTVRTPEGN